MTDVVQITDVLANLGEAPFWDEKTERILWVDLLDGSCLSTNAESGETERIDVGAPIAAFVRRVVGEEDLVVVRERDVRLLGDSDSRPVATLPLAAGVRANDGGCDPQGRLYVGSLAYDLGQGRGAIWRVSGQADPEAVVTGITLSNGLGWSPDGRTVYFVESGQARIEQFEFHGDDGSFQNRTTFVQFDAEVDGIPDGLCIDAEGGIWVAMCRGGAVRRYDPDGSLSAQLDIGCPTVTACSFGGPDRATLFITTAQADDPPPGDPGGALFATLPGVSGLPLHAFDPAGLL